MSEAHPTRCRWFQFSLGTMLAVVTAFAVWLGWELKFIRQRQSAIAEIESFGGYAVSDESEIIRFSTVHSIIRIPFWRRWLGDKTVIQLVLPYEYNHQEELTQGIVSLFPEAVLPDVWWAESHAPKTPNQTTAQQR